MVLGFAFAVVTVVSVAAPWIGLEPRTTGGARGDFAAWSGLLWLVLLAGLLWRSRARIHQLRAWAASRDSELADLVATSHEWTWESDIRFVLVSCGPAVARLLGRSPAEMVGRSLFEFMDDSDLPRARAVLTGALASGVGWDDVVIAWRHVDGSRLIMAGSAVPVVGSGGEVVGFRGSRAVVAAQRMTPELVDAARHIERIIEEEGLRIALQPVIDLTNRRCVAVEALSRFSDGSAPATLFAMAEEIGKGADLELLAIRKAFETLQMLPADVALSVNASAACVTDPRFSAELSTRDVHLSRVIVEITEHSAVTCYREIAAVLDPLRERGLRVAVDDVGAGYASFNHVLGLRPDVIKIDRSLVVDIDKDLARRSFVTAIMLLALDLRASVTAEGVERPEELAALVDLGVEHAQGYLISCPSLDREQWRRWPQVDWVELSQPMA